MEQEASSPITCTPALADFFQLPAWFELLLKFGFERKPYWVGNLPISPIGGGARGCGVFPLMRLTKTSPIQGVSNYYSPVFGPAWGAGVDAAEADLSGMLRVLRELPGSAVLMLQPFDQDDTFWRRLERGLELSGYRTDRFFCFGNWYEVVRGRTFGDYWALRPSRLRNTVERARRRLEQKQSWGVEVLTSPGAALERAIAAFEAVYARSWKQPEPCPGFMPGLIRMAAEMGALRLGQLCLGGEVVASQVWLVYGGKASIYKLAYVPGHERLSLGSVLTAALMHHVIDQDRVDEIDYLMGDDHYKQDWMSTRRERVGLIAFDTRSMFGLYAWARHNAGRWVRHLVK